MSTVTEQKLACPDCSVVSIMFIKHVCQNWETHDTDRIDMQMGP